MRTRAIAHPPRMVAVFTRDFAYFCYNSEIIGELSPHASR